MTLQLERRARPGPDAPIGGDLLEAEDTRVAAAPLPDAWSSAWTAEDDRLLATRPLPRGRRAMRLLAVAFALAFVTCVAIEPVPNGPEPAAPWWGAVAALALVSLVLAAVVSLANGVRWAPLVGVAAGLGMVLASAFLVTGREAWHLANLLQEPVYFVSGLNFPVLRLGFLGALALGTIPLAVGLDAMRQLAFSGAPVPVGTPPPEVEVLILVAMTAVFLVLARWSLRATERLARREGRLTVRWG